MKGILADHNCEGHLARLLHFWLNPYWADYWRALQLVVCTLADLSLPDNVADPVLWQESQQRQLVLITANRNKAKVDSLEVIIQQQNLPTSLPVLTLADPQRVLTDSAYAERTAEKILDYLSRIDQVRGVGRLFVP
jgi:Tfp pilus assembly pilus retraction ATPase PilT